jgi:HAD superfamily phosphoserine phosphatase-like hydrolase
MNAPLRLEVSLDDQSLTLMQADARVRRFEVSTAAKGMGFELGSFRTPTGRFRVCEKIGDQAPLGTIFKNRTALGCWQTGDHSPEDLVLTRILRLEGLDPENCNSFERNIYIHGTNREDLIGQIASHGCVRLRNTEMIELFDSVAIGTEMEIFPATQPRGKLLFLDCDSTLSTIEGIDELARARGPEVFAQVVELTNAAMNGEVPIAEVFARRMEMIRPDRLLCAEIAALYLATQVSGAAAWVAAAREQGWQVVILSGGFADLIQPLATSLGIDHVEAVPLIFDEDGNYIDYGRDYPTTRNLGKNEVIRQWKKALLPERVVMVGDGVSDLETRPDVDLFIGFGGVVARPAVAAGCDYWMNDMHDPAASMHILQGSPDRSNSV